MSFDCCSSVASLPKHNFIRGSHDLQLGRTSILESVCCSESDLESVSASASDSLVPYAVFKSLLEGSSSVSPHPITVHFTLRGEPMQAVIIASCELPLMISSSLCSRVKQRQRDAIRNASAYTCTNNSVLYERKGNERERNATKLKCFCVRHTPIDRVTRLSVLQCTCREHNTIESTILLQTGRRLAKLFLLILFLLC